ncbi:MAG: hypothetical protein WCP17_00010 [bacterium]
MNHPYEKLVKLFGEATRRAGFSEEDMEALRRINLWDLLKVVRGEAKIVVVSPN